MGLGRPQLVYRMGRTRLKILLLGFIINNLFIYATKMFQYYLEITQLLEQRDIYTGCEAYCPN